MFMEYNSPEITVVDLADLTVMLRCSCSRDDTNPY